MALRRREDVRVSRRIALVWSTITMASAVAVGVRSLLVRRCADDSERVFIVLADTMLNPVAGFVLAVLAAIMSTIDSQLLVCSSAIAEDIYRGLIRPNVDQKELVWLSRFSVVAVALLAAVMGMNPESSILDLVSYAWGGFGAAFGPVILFSLFWRGMNRNGAIAGLVIGAATVAIWKPLTGGPAGLFDIFEVVPGFVLSSLAVVGISLLTNGDREARMFDGLMAEFNKPADAEH